MEHIYFKKNLDIPTKEEKYASFAIKRKEM